MAAEIKENLSGVIHDATKSIRNVIDEKLNHHLGTENQRRCEE